MKADADDAIDNMTLIDSIYTAAGLGPRQPTSYFMEGGSRNKYRGGKGALSRK
jgi:hypothetical protein